MNTIIKAIESILQEHERMKNAYFFTPPRNASARRSYEKYHSHDLIEWQEGTHIYTAQFIVRCSCNNVYVSRDYTRDGKKTTITTIRNSYKRMKEEA